MNIKKNNSNKAMDIFRDEIELFLSNEAFLLPIDDLDTPNTH